MVIYLPKLVLIPGHILHLKLQVFETAHDGQRGTTNAASDVYDQSSC